jgi:ubiquinone/menaquinone biosynthesis C-methylase UbiE
MTHRIASTYEKYAGDPGENYERYFVPSIGVPSARPVIEAAGVKEGDRVLDVACGTGVAARLAAQRVGPTGAVAGVDPTPPMLEVARRTSSAIDWLEGSAEMLPVPDDSFDVVLCSLGFQFFTDKIKSLQEMHRVLRAGGRAALGTPGPTPPLFEAIEEALTDHVGPAASAFVDAVFSVHDPDQVRELAANAGFSDVEIDTGPLPLRLPPPAEFFWQYVHSTPLAGPAAQLDEAARAALERDVVVRCQPFVDDDALVMAPSLLVATAQRN